MANDATRAEFWRQFIATRCEYPAPARLQAQLAVAEFFDFCACGCNSFAVRIPEGAGVVPLAAPSRDGGRVFEADFQLSDGKSLQVLIFVGKEGDLKFIEIDCCGNSCPVPGHIDGQERPFFVWTSWNLLPDPPQPDPCLALPQDDT